MKQACVEAIAQTLGRQPKADELKGIEDRIKEAVREVHKKNAVEGKTGIPDAQTYMEAADLVRQRVVHDVYKKRQRVAQNAIAISRVTDTLDANIPPEQQTPANLQQFIFAGRRTTDGKDIAVTSAEELATGAYQTGLASSALNCSKPVMMYANSSSRARLLASRDSAAC